MGLGWDFGKWKGGHKNALGHEEEDKFKFPLVVKMCLSPSFDMKIKLLDVDVEHK